MDLEYISTPPPLPSVVSVRSFLATCLYPLSSRCESSMEGFVHVSVMATMSGLRSTIVALSSSSFDRMLLAFVERILIFLPCMSLM